MCKHCFHGDFQFIKSWVSNFPFSLEMSDQAEIEQLAEAEYEKLQKHLRSIQLNLKSLNEEKNIQLKKQQKTISVLQGEHEKLKEDIRILEEGTHARKKNDVSSFTY